ncbi:hypothetical protein SISSUDRAFT_1053457 [Sistotremastrum suecicum HHB10207 ss-3]|uniref:Zn(2)-C6 fungal-type domain-containing protein n=1 Tax=Sistotremastrum suecicum HHB10207 ss-3 TaxID=1314776 RepID=A0A165Z714_9AGAM|nr:hypothetical protein SISSUDRAFT_1053457 [Sistotremastrum suecicum HHB10207 ss-3]
MAERLSTPQDSLEKLARKPVSSKPRSSRACDRCRRTKSKCEANPASARCKNCDNLDVPCEYIGPNRKRGPPKGYLHALERRLHDVEALVGIVLSLSDPRAQSLLADLSSSHDYVKDVLSQVDVSPFGPSGRSANRKSQEGGATAQGEDHDGPSDHSSYDPWIKGPTNQWQDLVIAKFTPLSVCNAPAAGPLISESSTRSSTAFPSRPMSADHFSHKEKSVSSEDEEENPGGGASTTSSTPAMGRLSLDDADELHYYGDASGLPFLEKNVKAAAGEEAQLDDPASNSRPMVTQDMPDRTVQEHLLSLYFVYTYAAFPFVRQEDILTQFAQSWDEKGQFRCSSDFRLLLLAMYSLSARHSTLVTASQHERNGILVWEAGDEFSDQAKSMLADQAYKSSRPSTCQALLLLAIREFGMGGMTEAWLYTGIAIRMALDLGMNRSGETWKRNGRHVFTEHQKTVRKRIWLSCVKLDKYISMYMGRPIAIHEDAYDTDLPPLEDGDELNLWFPDALRSIRTNYLPVSARLMQCCHANSRLSRVVGRILERLYAVHIERLKTDKETRQELVQNLQSWLNDLPEDLQVQNVQRMYEVPPHFLMLHLQYWTAMILIHRPFIRFKSSSKTPHGLAVTPLDKCVEACLQIKELVSAFRANFSLSVIPPVVVFEIFGAGIIWAATTKIDPTSAQASDGLQFCLNSLQEIEFVWPAAGTCRQLLAQATLPDTNSTNAFSFVSDDPDAPSLDQIADNTSFMQQLFGQEASFAEEHQIPDFWTSSIAYPPSPHFPSYSDNHL